MANGMVEVYRDIAASPQEIFSVLADGWTYASWVVGASHMRDVDPHWPAVGARLHHRVGPWPFSIDDTTHVVTMEPDRLLELDAHVWPMGSARARLTLEPLGPDRTRVRFAEALSSRLARHIPESVQATVIGPRNRESLARLEDLAVNRVRAGRR
jgi:Polyketide cyclase / dehydrase and lipid transport